MKKGIKIKTVNRNNETGTREVESLILGRVYGDCSFGGLIKLYNDESGTFQMKFLVGSDIASSFLPKCRELLEILEAGIIGVSLEMIAEELLQKGYEKVITRNAAF